jgi:hypothetical protein
MIGPQVVTPCDGGLAFEGLAHSNQFHGRHLTVSRAFDAAET